jgi:hypothetical protein
VSWQAWTFFAVLGLFLIVCAVGAWISAGEIEDLEEEDDR